MSRLTSLEASETPQPRVAWLSNETPDRLGTGGQRRQYHQIKALVGAGVEVSVACRASSQDDASVREVAPVHRVPYHRGDRFHRSSTRAIRRFLKAFRPHGAVVAHIESLPAVQPGLGDLRIPWLVDFHNVNSRWAAVCGDRRAEAQWHARETAALTAADMATCCSTEELDALRLGSESARIKVAANGVDPHEWPAAALDIEPKRAAAIFGSWFHGPNAHGAEWLMAEVWPLVLDQVEDARLLLAGPGEAPEPPSGLGGVERVGRVPDLARFLAGVQVVAVPIVQGVGARVKFAESLASGRPVVSTALGAQGAGADGMFLEANDALSFAASCVDLMRDQSLSARLGQQGRQWALSQQSWQQTTVPMLRWARALARRLPV